MYRYATPQRGRYREHWHLSVEAIGSADPAIDAELIQLYDELLARLGVTNYRLLLNSIGDETCRPAYLERLTAWLDEHDDVLDEGARQKRATNPLRVFDVKSAEVQEALADAPKIGEALCDECRAHFDQVKTHLDDYGIEYTLKPTLVRGLDYYTRTAFEFVDEAIGAQSSIAGGGRYDGLIEEIGGPATPGIGFGAGIERLLLSVEAAGVSCLAFQGISRLRCADLKARIDSGQIGEIVVLHQVCRWSIADSSMPSRMCEAAPTRAGAGISRASESTRPTASMILPQRAVP